jgi:hypothetical protein
MRYPFLRRGHAGLVVLTLVVASCAGDASTAAPVDSTTAPRPSSTRVVTTRPTATTVPPTTEAPTTEAPPGEPFDPEEVIATDEPVRGPATTLLGVVPEASGYTGLLGSLGIDDVLFGAPAGPPEAVARTAPLTGLPIWIPNRPAVIVKVDNSQAARPQRGLNAADIVFEEQVEGGITRLAAVFHSNMAIVGPVRSGRTTDISFINAFGGPAFLYSGANRIIDAILMRQTTVQNYAASRSSGYWRDSSRRIPHNLFTDTSSFVFSGSTPPPQFAYGATDTDAASTRVPATVVTAGLGQTRVRWDWDGGSWLRTQNGTPHLSDGAQVSAANVVMAVVPEGPTGLVDSAGSRVPEYIFAGSGPVSVFAAGRRTDGTWTRPSLRSPAILVDTTGAVIELTPGRTWVELVLPGTYQSS